MRGGWIDNRRARRAEPYKGTGDPKPMHQSVADFWLAFGTLAAESLVQLLTQPSPGGGGVDDLLSDSALRKVETYVF